MDGAGAISISQRFKPRNNFALNGNAEQVHVFW